jgi:hypothetical protein
MQTQQPKRQLRSFGLTVGGVFLFVAIWPLLRRGQNPRLWALLLGGALFLAGVIVPTVLRRPYQLWMRVADVLAWINTRIILSIIFYAVFTPAAVIVRLIGKDPMNRMFLPNVDTYRVLRSPRNASHMKHQF